MSVQVKRAYEKPGPRDGRRILVDALWPRGLKKDALSLDEWMRDIAPSPGLRKWYGHKAEKWEGFREKYRSELSKTPRCELVNRLVAYARKQTLTLVFAAHDAERSNAAVLAELINKGI